MRRAMRKCVRNGGHRSANHRQCKEQGRGRSAASCSTSRRHKHNGSRKCSQTGRKTRAPGPHAQPNANMANPPTSRLQGQNRRACRQSRMVIRAPPMALQRIAGRPATSARTTAADSTGPIKMTGKTRATEATSATTTNSVKITRPPPLPKGGGFTSAVASALDYFRAYLKRGKFPEMMLATLG
jgi:hypothetical protein